MFDNKELARNASGFMLKDDSAMPDMAAMRQYRLARLQAQIQAHECAAAILLGTINVRYATGTRSMRNFGMHHPTRVAVVPGHGGEGVKLEEQVVVTVDGCQLMSTFPYESALLEWRAPAFLPAFAEVQSIELM